MKKVHRSSADGEFFTTSEPPGLRPTRLKGRNLDRRWQDVQPHSFVPARKTPPCRRYGLRRHFVDTACVAISSTRLGCEARKNWRAQATEIIRKGSNRLLETGVESSERGRKAVGGVSKRMRCGNSGIAGPKAKSSGARALEEPGLGFLDETPVSEKGRKKGQTPF